PMLGQSIQQVPVYEQDLVNEESVFLERNAVALELAMDQAAERAKKAAGKRFKKAERATIKLNMTVIGDPSLRAKSVVEIEGIPQSMSGKYFVHSVKHNISSSGYTCDLKMTRDAKGHLARKAGLHLQGGRRNRKKMKEVHELMRVGKDGNTYIEYYEHDSGLIGYEDSKAKQSIYKHGEQAEEMTWEE
ncbi:MAG: hypothetical protein GY847_42165, partial [Proteobacteria bacterium]|nr:hypothetical protein [Pseudomonadota bacterium]